jgi:hypothetical protein
MTTITAKQNALENLCVATDFMASFLDFEISKLEERCEHIRAGMNVKEFSESNQELICT